MLGEILPRFVAQQHWDQEEKELSVKKIIKETLRSNDLSIIKQFLCKVTQSDAITKSKLPK